MKVLHKPDWLEKPKYNEQKTRETVMVAYQNKLYILVAEDNPINQKVIRKVLDRLGFSIDLAANGQEAVHALTLKEYDLIFMDMQMPEMNGIEATRKIRATTLPRAQPIIIAMTANAQKDDQVKCLEAGMDDYLSKPVRMDELKDMLIKWFPLTISQP